MCSFVANFATSCSRPMKLLHYVSQAPHTNICNSIMHKDLQNAAISLNESNSWRRLTTKDQKWLRIEAFDRKPGFSSPCVVAARSIATRLRNMVACGPIPPVVENTRPLQVPFSICTQRSLYFLSFSHAYCTSLLRCCD